MRRRIGLGLFVVIQFTTCWAPTVFGQAVPKDNPVLARYKDKAPAWTADLKWDFAVSIQDFKGETVDQRFQAAQAALAANGGGVVFFPAGTYRFQDSVRLKNGVVIRGEKPQTTEEARDEKYALRTIFEFPVYKPVFAGDGTPNPSAFKGVSLEDAGGGRQVGLVHVDLRYGHVDLGVEKDFSANFEADRCGRNWLVLGCILRNAAVLDPNIPMRNWPNRQDEVPFQEAWQRWTHRHHAAIQVHAAGNVLIANNRIPESGEANFVMKGYKLFNGTGSSVGLKDPSKLKIHTADILFDYDNRPGISVNFIAMGKELSVWAPYLAPGVLWKKGETPPAPPKVPWASEIPAPPAGLAKGIEIRDNYLFCSGCTAIRFTGDGTACTGNVIRFKPNVKRPTARGYQFDAFTNNNRAIEIRGWRWAVEHNDYEVYSNLGGPDGTFKYNDGEGIMHEAWDNCGIVDSRVVGNRGNTYLSIWRVPMDGLLVQGNEIDNLSLGSGAGNKPGPRREMPVRNVQVIGNKANRIGVGGEPNVGGRIKDNIAPSGKGVIMAPPGMTRENNQGFSEGP